MNTLRIFLIAFILSTVLAIYSPYVNAQQVNVNLSVFQNDLGRYGSWVNSPRYGQVWIYSEPGFRPYYSNGHWEYSSYGWAWVSDYEWGWGPFHYGRWEEDPYYGWIWIPGYEWAPAWVSWSEYGGNYGWAPLGFGLNINVSFGSIPFNRWAFVPRNYICSPNLHNYYINPGRNHGFRNAVVINNVYVNNNVRFYAGPGRRDVERYTRSSVPVRNIDYGRPNHIAINDRFRNNNGNNSTIDRPGRIERPQRNDVPDRGNGARPFNNLPERMERDRTPDRQTDRRTPERQLDRTPGGQTDRVPQRQMETMPDRSSERTIERTQRPSFERPERSSAPTPQRMERQSSPERVERQQQPRSQGNFGGMQRTPEVRQQPMERSQRPANSGRVERSDNNSRGGRRG